MRFPENTLISGISVTSSVALPNGIGNSADKTLDDRQGFRYDRPMSEKMEKKRLAILRFLSGADHPQTSPAIAEHLIASGHEMSERTIRLYLQELDEEGLTENHGKRGRTITEKGIAELGNASAKAFSFAVEIGYATPETVGPMLQKAQVKARALVAEAGIPVPGMMDLVLAKAAANAKAIASMARGEPVQTPTTAAAPTVAAEEKKEEKKDEGDAAAGLGALFG